MKPARRKKGPRHIKTRAVPVTVTRYYGGGPQFGYAWSIVTVRV